MFKVLKKDGNVQDFDKSKIINGVQKSGAAPKTAEAVAYEIEMWLPKKAKGGKISYLDIKTKVIEILRSKDSKAADNFVAYK